MYDVDSGIVCIEEARHKNIGGRFWREAGEDLRSAHRFHLTVQESNSRRALFTVTSFVPLQLVVILLLVFGKVVFDFRELRMSEKEPRRAREMYIPRQEWHTNVLRTRKWFDYCSPS